MKNALPPSTARSRAIPAIGRWHTTTFRWMCIYAVMFTLTVVVLVGTIARVATIEMERESDQVMNWQRIYFNSIPDAELGTEVRRRLEREPMQTNFYGLFSAAGKPIAGDIVEYPAMVEPGQEGQTLQHKLLLAGGLHSPTVRAMIGRRKNGDLLVIARDLTPVLRIRDRIIKVLWLGGIACLTAGVLGGALLSMRQLRRVRAIRRATHQIAQGDLQQRLPVGGRDELDMLSQLVNHMLDEVERLMHEVKGACDGIAHDLRTPLAHIRVLLSNIETRTHDRQDADLAAMLARARDETDRLLERFRAMLRISEIGSLRRRGGFAPLDLRALVIELSDLYEPLADSHGLRWILTTEAVPLIHGDRALLFEALSNLIDNAIKFAACGAASGSVHVLLRATPAGPCLDITDTGPGIAPNEREAVLQPFYRSEEALAVEGSGLGLGIVAAVLRLHDFRLSISDAAPGACMHVDCWPRSLI